MAQQRIGHYEILDEVAKGGQATVYCARDLNLGRIVALKILHPHLAGDPQFRERFLREARMAASLTHPNFITIHDVGEDAGQLYMAMEYLPSSLHGLLNELGPLPVDDTIGIVRQVAAALNAAHQHGVVHRDIKPQNILPTSEGTPKVTYEVGRPLTSFHVSRRFSKLLQLAGLPMMRYHDLRHGAASLMAAQGVPARVAMEILGHAQISTTMNIYTHIAPELQREAAERLSSALWPDSPSELVSKLVSTMPINEGVGPD